MVSSLSVSPPMKSSMGSSFISNQENMKAAWLGH